MPQTAPAVLASLVNFYQLVAKGPSEIDPDAAPGPECIQVELDPDQEEALMPLRAREFPPELLSDP